jgi:hypothetical protein
MGDARRRHTPEQIIRKLREADRLLGEGEGAGNSVRPLSRRGLVFVDEASEHVSPPNAVKSNDGF